MKIVVGLGNYGDQYANTYHNLGFLAAECLCERLGGKFNVRECDSLVAVIYLGGEKIVIAKPLTYMNLSGVAVKQLLKKYQATEQDLIVIFDDIDLPKFSVRVRLEGSGGTHNGMRNIIDKLGTKNFKRVRIGAGRPPENFPLADYVLSQISRGEREQMAEAILQGAQQVEKLLTEPSQAKTTE